MIKYTCDECHRPIASTLFMVDVEATKTKCIEYWHFHEGCYDALTLKWGAK